MISATQLARTADLPYRVVDHWIRRGILQPHDPALPGSGSPRTFDESEIPVAAACAALRAFLSLDALRRVAFAIRIGTRGVVWIDAQGFVASDPFGAVALRVDLDAFLPVPV